MPTSRQTIIGIGSVLAVALSIAVPQIEKFEGLRHEAYSDIVGVLTICYGHTGPDVRVNTYKTTDQCYVISKNDAAKAAESILKYTPTLKNNPNQLAAAISFTYNVGFKTYQNSSVARDFNSKNYVLGCNDMMKYVYAGGKYSQGLYNRRKAEYDICMKGLTK